VLDKFTRKTIEALSSIAMAMTLSSIAPAAALVSAWNAPD
jgi:hypothetical protein